MITLNKMKQIEKKLIKKKDIINIKKLIKQFEKEIKPLQISLNKNEITEDLVNKGAELETSILDLKNILRQIEYSQNNLKCKYLNPWVSYILKKYNLIYIN